MKPKKKRQDSEMSFENVARSLGCDEDSAHFDAARKKVARHKPPTDTPPQAKEPKTKTRPVSRVFQWR